ncbi:peptidoglycan recognition protein family protein [Streptomyces antimicrobicus]|uniref:Peptidoglycan recognition protein family protein n=1 Tax=Streptomyces antimicrobicus TaxID=2883108 RepID=A0ABS8BFA3_9ACTN|nr:peptidoglycan recognition family protein [Streptomyces antimicrobicus]MCB5183295.1 peptidoglycan recognition protein family protein [Streptomyces antimicrobicus]
MTSRLQPPLTRRTLLTGALALGTAAALPLAAAARARAATGPEIAACGTWGARAASEQVVILDSPPQRIVIHHTATANVTDYSKDRAYALARAIQRYHMDTHGWIDTGQHFTISRGAFVMEGRHHSLDELRAGARQVRAAHCVGQNNTSIGIENEGTYTSVEPPAAQYAALVEMCAHICRQYRIPAAEIYGHRDFNDTGCPGDRLYAMLPKLRRDVAGRTGETATDPLWELVRDLPGGGGLGQSDYFPDGIPVLGTAR